jgi:hypothetical protein
VDAERNGTTGLLRSLHSPRALLAGVAFSFLACCAAGEWVSRRDTYAGQERFHPRLSLETHHYPTARQVIAFAEHRLDRDRVAVIVGGNSVLYGYGQDLPDLWTRHLQEELGDGYRVVNLGARGAHPAEFGGVVAEALSRKGYQVIYATGFGTPGISQSFVDGSPDRYRYFFWDAYERGLLRDHPARQEELNQALAARRRDEAFAELRRGTGIDRATSNRDLWTAVAYRHVATVWEPTVRASVLRPRCRYPDAEPLAGGVFSALPYEQRYPAAHEEACLAMARDWCGVHQRFTRGADWIRMLQAVFPEEDRRHTLMVGVPDSPHFVRRLTSAEQAAYRATFAAAVTYFEDHGFSALAVGADWTEDDFFDRCHVGPHGSRKLAAEVAPKVRQMAEELGYLSGGGAR